MEDLRSGSVITAVIPLEVSFNTVSDNPYSPPRQSTDAPKRSLPRQSFFRYSCICLIPAIAYYAIEPGIFYDNLVLGSVIFGFAFCGFSRFLTPRNIVSPIVAIAFGYAGSIIWANRPTISGYQFFNSGKLTCNPGDDLISAGFIGVLLEFIVFAVVAASQRQAQAVPEDAG